MRKIAVLLILLLVGCWNIEGISVFYVNREEDIEVAIQSIAELGGGKLVLGEGTFYISSPIELVSNMIIEGQGANTILRATTSTRIIDVLDVENGVIRNLAIDGDKRNVTGIYVNRGKNIRIQNIEIHDVTRGIDAFGTMTLSSISGCNIERCSDEGISLLGNGIKDCEISGNVLSSCGDGFLAYGDNNLIINNTLLASKIFINGEDCHFANNMVRLQDGNWPYGVTIGHLSNNCLISNNDLYQSGTISHILDQGTNTNFGAGNRGNDGEWDNPLDTQEAGDAVIYHDDREIETTNITWTKMFEATVGFDGEVKVSYNKTIYAGEVRTYKNDSPVGTIKGAGTGVFDENVPCKNGDRVQLYGKAAGYPNPNLKVKDFRLSIKSAPIAW